MSERFAPTFEAIVLAWHASNLADDDIAPVATALGRYQKIGAELAGYRHRAAASITDLAANVVAGTTTFADGLTDWTALTAGRQPGRGSDLDQSFANECRRQARRATEAAAAAINWHSVVTSTDATDELRQAIRTAGLAS